MQCGSGAELVATAINMDGPRALESRLFNGSLLLRVIGECVDRGVYIGVCIYGKDHRGPEGVGGEWGGLSRAEKGAKLLQMASTSHLQMKSVCGTMETRWRPVTTWSICV
jgi:hypothetical protein